jgi:hypothetical protein
MRHHQPTLPTRKPKMQSLRKPAEGRLSLNQLVFPQPVKAAYEKLLRDDKFLDACGRGTAGEERVKTRINLATEAFAGLT